MPSERAPHVDEDHRKEQREHRSGCGVVSLAAQKPDAERADRHHVVVEQPRGHEHRQQNGLMFGGNPGERRRGKPNHRRRRSGAKKKS